MTKNKTYHYSITKILGYFFLALVIFALFGVALQYREAYRLYKVITLFDEGQIVENFQHMSDIFPARTIEKGESNFHFETSPLKMSQHFEYKGEKINIAEYLTQTSTTGFIVIKDNQIVFEDYALGNTIDSLHISWSVNKSFISALVGIAVEEGFIQSITDPIDKYVPTLKNTGYQGVIIEDILQMSSGVAFNEDYRDFHSDINRMGRVIALGSSINEFAASLKADKTPGTYHHYVSMDTQVLGMLLQAATGQPLSRYLEDKIWKKLGMRSDAKWLVDDLGMELAFGTLNVTLRDYARFGLLYQNYGVWNGEQIVPRQWVSDSITTAKPHLLPGDNPASSSRFGYGYQWWIPPQPDGDFMARGVYGQYIYVNPQKRVVIVKQSADPFWRSGGEEKYKTTVMFQAIANFVSQANQLPFSF